MITRRTPRCFEHLGNGNSTAVAKVLDSTQAKVLTLEYKLKKKDFK